MVGLRLSNKFLSYLLTRSDWVLVLLCLSLLGARSNGSIVKVGEYFGLWRVLRFVILVWKTWDTSLRSPHVDIFLDPAHQSDWRPLSLVSMTLVKFLHPLVRCLVTLVFSLVFSPIIFLQSIIRVIVSIKFSIMVRSSRIPVSCLRCCCLADTTALCTDVWILLVKLDLLQMLTGKSHYIVIAHAFLVLVHS